MVLVKCEIEENVPMLMCLCQLLRFFLAQRLLDASVLRSSFQVFDQKQGDEHKRVRERELRSWREGDKIMFSTLNIDG